MLSDEAIKAVATGHGQDWLSIKTACALLELRRAVESYVGIFESEAQEMGAKERAYQTMKALVPNDC